MNKQEFIQTLKQQLSGLPAVDRDEILYDYQEHFRIGLENGKNEEEIASSLGDPKVIAKQFHVGQLVKQAEADTTFSNTFKAVLATLGLGFFNLVFVLGPFIGLVGALIGLFAAGGGILIGGIATMAATIAAPILPASVSVSLPFSAAATFFLAIGLICLGLLLLIATFYLSKYFFIGTLHYLKFNLKIIKGA